MGPMVADYISVSYVNSNPFGVFAAAKAPPGGELREAMYTTRQPLLAAMARPRFSSKGEQPVPNAKSDYESKAFYDDEGRFPTPEWKLPQRDPQ